MSRRHLAGAAVALAIAAALTFGVGPYSALSADAPEHALLDALPRSDALAFLAQLGDVGRSRYRVVLVWDSLFTLVHGACVFAFLRFPLERLHHRLAWLAWLALGATALDLLENATIYGLILRPTPALAEAPMFVTTGKFIALMIAAAVLVLAWLALAGRGLRSTIARSSR